MNNTNIRQTPNINVILGIVNKNKRTQEEVKAMGLGRCNIVCMRKAGNKDINQSQYVAKL
jgi:hypothetical protein